MINKLKIILQVTIIIAVVTLCLPYTTIAQVWNNTDNSNYTAGQDGEIRMTGSKTSTDIHGTILKLGTTDATRISHKVVWAKAMEVGVVQLVQDGLYFEDLWLEGSKKTVQNVFVSGFYNAGDSVSPENINYVNKFTYDGEITGQKIAPAFTYNQVYANDHSANAYDTLILASNNVIVDKNIPFISGNDGQVFVRGSFLLNNNVTLQNNGDLTLISNGENTKSYINGNLSVNSTGTFNIRDVALYNSVTGDNDVVVIDETGSLEINGTAAGTAYDASYPAFTKAGLSMAGGRLEVYGKLENKIAALNNVNLINWNASYPASTVAYYGTGTVMPTICKYPYGTLEMASDLTAPESINRNLAANTYIIGNTKASNYTTSVANNALVFSAEYGGMLTTNNDTLVFIAGNATYANDLGEVVGWIKHSNCDENSSNIVSSTPYTFHNSKTKLTFVNGDANYFAMQSLPNTMPSKKMPGDDELYIKRQIEIDYSAKDDNFRISEMQIGYKANEVTGNNDIEKAEVVDNLRFAEGWMNSAAYVSAGKRIQPIVAKDGNGIAVPLIRDSYQSNALLSVTQKTSTNNDIKLMQTGNTPGTVADIYTHSQILLTAIPFPVISVKNGRWSNPGTWEMGETPKATDSVIVEHQVYTGLWIDATTKLFGENPYTKAEDKLATGTPVEFTDGNILAKHVVIRPNLTGSANSALIIGNSVGATAETMDFTKVLAFGVNCENGIGVVTPATDIVPLNFSIEDAKNNYSSLSGLYVMPLIGTTESPIIRTTNLINAGVVTNGSIIEIGN